MRTSSTTLSGLRPSYVNKYDLHLRTSALCRRLAGLPRCTGCSHSPWQGRAQEAQCLFTFYARCIDPRDL